MERMKKIKILKLEENSTYLGMEKTEKKEWRESKIGTIDKLNAKLLLQRRPIPRPQKSRPGSQLGAERLQRRDGGFVLLGGGLEREEGELCDFRHIHSALYFFLVSWLVR